VIGWGSWNAPTYRVAWGFQAAAAALQSLNAAPNTPVNVSPANGATEIPLVATLQSSAFSDTWTSHTHAASHWQIAAANDFSTSPPLVWDSGRQTGNLTEIAVPAGVLQDGATYYWRVRHQDNVGARSAWSAATWFVITAGIPRESNRNWWAVVSSADGTKLVACARAGRIYTSSDSGATWTARESNRDWLPVASSADGTKLVAGVYGGQIYTSPDSGATWTPPASPTETGPASRRLRTDRNSSPASPAA